LWRRPRPKLGCGAKERKEEEDFKINLELNENYVTPRETLENS
jgi:hypothetical protein